MVKFAIECLIFSLLFKDTGWKWKQDSLFPSKACKLSRGSLHLGAFQVKDKIPLRIHSINKRLRSIYLISGTFFFVTYPKNTPSNLNSLNILLQWQHDVNIGDKATNFLRSLNWYVHLNCQKCFSFWAFRFLLHLSDKKMNDTLGYIF